MREFRPAAKLWVEVVVLAAISTTIGTHQLFGLDKSNWIAFGLLAVCAAFAHVFPIRPAFDNVTYHLTNAFMIAAAMLLAPYQAALLPALALAPDLWLRRGVPGVPVFWAFNASQTSIATLATLAWLRWTGAQQLDDGRDVATLLVGVGIFTLVQAVLVGVVVSLNSRRPLLQAGTLSRGALLSDAGIGLGGLLVGGLWLVKPALLVALPPLLFALHRATRVAHMAELAERDTKTGLYNARHLERVLEHELLRSQHLGRPLAILFVDLDRFKQVNDRHGHDAGDLVLRDVAAVLTQHVRRGDVVARFVSVARSLSLCCPAPRPRWRWSSPRRYGLL
jgi:GGDEF domain-containing protein